jgi:glycosyltransferase involved in cell wall biosynthesis
MPLAIVHDYLNQLGGAEKTLNTLLRLTPEATVYTSVMQPDVRAACVPQDVSVRCSFLQRFPLAPARTRLYLPLLPLAFEKLNLTGHELIVSVSSAFAKGVCPPAGVPHLCYCQTPMRFAWNLDGYLRYERVSSATRAVVRLLMARFRDWDVRTASRVTEFIAISRTVQQRVDRFYGRDSRIIYPPVDTKQYHPVDAAQKGDYYLVLSRLLPYKRIDVAIEACNRLGLPLMVAGEGRDERRLRQLAGPTVRFLGRVSDEEAAQLLARARALILAAEEDFGLTPVEAMAAGTPVIAYRGGGATETVVEGETGLFFDWQEPESLAEALRRYRPDDYAPERCVERARRFDAEHFLSAWRQLLREYGYQARAEAA